MKGEWNQKKRKKNFDFLFFFYVFSNSKLQPAEEQRENAYELAESINAQLNTMDETLSNLIGTLNSQQYEEVDSEVCFSSFGLFLF